MRKFLFISLIVFMVCGITGCGYLEKFKEDSKEEVTESEELIIHNDPEGMFSFQYPEKYSIEVKNRKVEELNFPLGHTKETAEKDIESLKHGNYGESIDFATEESQEVVDLEELNGKSFMVLGRFDVCDVAFERKLIFYTSDRQVMVTLSGSEEEIMESMSEYFGKNEENCEDMTVWKFEDDVKGDFYNILQNGQGSEEAQGWYDAFNEIIKTIKLN